LVVDDERRSVELLARTLRGLGRVETCTSAREAWERSQRETIDLVIADQRMPEMCGVELLARIAERDETTGRILLTGYADIGATIDAINRGRVHAYLGKPWAPQELEETARALLERVGLEREKERLLADLRTATRGLEILAVASAPADGRALAEALEPLGRVRVVRPEDFGRLAALLDCAAAVALLEGGDRQSLDALMPLCELPAARAIVLVVRKVGDVQMEEAIRRLDPLQVLEDPVPAPALRLAVRRGLPATGAGEGARLGQRRAPTLLGVSGAIREVLEQIRRVGPSGLPVLVLGETGTGKELVARAIHDQSSRAGRSFVAVNCGALPDTLLESELFGFRRGAFTGADRDKRGLFEEADGGTLFLDEVGDMPPALQAKLLRALEQQEIRPLGGTQTIDVDVRVVSATHRDLEAAVDSGQFRRDLFYRLNTVTLHLPPLRRRRVDIPFLAQHFAEEFGEVNARRIVLGEDFLEALARHDFPGNVRELRNAVDRAVALTRPGQTVGAARLEARGVAGASRNAPRRGTLRERLEQVEAEAIREALERYAGNRTHVAEALGLSRHGLRQKIRRLGLLG